MKVAVVTAGSPEYAELSAVTTPTKQRYAERHGYDFHFFETTRQRGDACKFDCYQALMGKGYDIFFWSDLDALIMNGREYSIDRICWDWMLPSVHFLWGYDMGGPNSGVYLARFTPQGHHFMDRAYATMLENGLADETAMEMTMLVAPFKDWVRTCPGWVLNAYDYSFYGWDRFGHGETINKYVPGSFILHMPGYDNSVRIPELKRRAAEAF